MKDQDPFVGTWKMRPERSNFDPKHNPSEGTMRFERESGGYVMRAKGVCEGRPVEEPPVRFVLDGKSHPVPGAPDIIALSTLPDPKTILVEARRGDQIVGQASYAVSADGAALTATVSGIDIQHRPFRTTVVWTRQ